MRCSKSQSLDHFVGAREQGYGRVEAQCLGGLHVNDKLKFVCELDWQLAWLFPPENSIDVGGGAPVEINVVSAVGCQTAACRVIAIRINVRQAVTVCEGNDQRTLDAGPILECYHFKKYGPQREDHSGAD
jgi:hypothetical protein